MKKIFLICLLLFSSTILAESRDQFQIKINNAMSADCRLKDPIILFGHVSDHTSIPIVIHPNQTATFLMRSGPRYGSQIYKDKSFLLTYVCDYEQEITLFANAGRSVDSKRLDVKNMWATFKSNRPINSNTPILGRSEIEWTLTY